MTTTPTQQAAAQSTAVASPRVLVEQFGAAAAVLAALSRDAAEYRDLPEAELLELNTLTARMRRFVDSPAALIAGEIARRSVPALGSAGLAQRTGFRTPEEFVRVTTGSTGRDASTSVRVGRMLTSASSQSADPAADESAAETAAEPWLAPVASAVEAGELSIAAADAIRSGLGIPSDDISLDILRGVAMQLCLDARNLDVDRLFRRARQLRDEVDAAGIADRETARREARSLRIIRLPDGMGRIIWDLDPESLAIVTNIYDRATSPRRGGPRFRDELQEQADRILEDTRTTEQLASDTFLHLFRAGASNDPSELLGGQLPAVRVLVSASALRSRSGHGHIEGQPDAISIETVERIVCGQGIQEVVLDDRGNPIDVGREQRLFTPRQRTALAVRDGGCQFGDCDRPPSWCEAHHIEHWARDEGSTDIQNGVLLCKHHHLLLHNNGWEISRDALGERWLIPPAEVDPSRTPRPMKTKSPIMDDFTRELAMV
jgi:hypothetical protein